jgi:hypothetical protein
MLRGAGETGRRRQQPGAAICNACSFGAAVQRIPPSGWSPRRSPSAAALHPSSCRRGGSSWARTERPRDRADDSAHPPGRGAVCLFRVDRHAPLEERLLPQPPTELAHHEAGLLEALPDAATASRCVSAGCAKASLQGPAMRARSLLWRCRCRLEWSMSRVYTAPAPSSALPLPDSLASRPSAWAPCVAGAGGAAAARGAMVDDAEVLAYAKVSGAHSSTAAPLPSFHRPQQRRLQRALTGSPCCCLWRRRPTAQSGSSS